MFIHKFRKKSLTSKKSKSAKKEMLIFTLISLVLVPLTFASHGEVLGDFMYSIHKLLTFICIFTVNNMIYLGGVLFGGKTYTNWK